MRQREAATALGISERHLRRLLADGIVRPIRTREDLAAAQAVLEARARSREDARTVRLREWTRLAKEKADAQAMANERLRSELVGAQAAREAVAGARAHVARHLRALPARWAPLLVGLASVPALQAALGELVREALEALATPPRPRLVARKRKAP
ncbi:MAG: hypothetical protein OZ948_00395 [Deltaproteobacteria bacterium]|nr:hypothetical protein [Deltaproteobacteria bacterium]